MSKFLDLFDNDKPIIGMLHLGRRPTKASALDLTKDEIDTYLNNGISEVIVEDYFGDLEDVQQTLEYLWAGIVVTGAGTGLETPLNKAKNFKEIMGNYLLIIGAGLTLDNCVESLSIGDTAIVGSYVKNNHQDNGEVSSEYVKRLVNKINTIRK
ncbi:MAG: BtpA/SgcQ family protein [Bacilli bacterium]|nr:BtpA/SgcQ family protein [Bacilli bacterium]